MKKIVSAVLAGSIFALSIGIAAPANAQEEQSTPVASVQKSSVSDVYNQYLDVLQRYKMAQDNGFYQYPNNDLAALEQLDINNVLAASSTKTLEYALVDLQKDGTPELIIATHDYAISVMPYNIYDVFSIVNGHIIRPIDDFSMGYKSWYTITENGYLDNLSFAGAKNERHEYISIDATTGAPTYKESLEYDSWSGDKYYRAYGRIDFSQKSPISKVEYDSIKAQYASKNNITWHPIGDYASLWNELTANTIPVFVDGIQIDFDQQPIIQDGRTLVPLRGVFEALGATVDWDGATRSVIAYKDGTTVELVIGSAIMYVNGQPRSLNVAGQIINDRTMIPLRAVSEAFGADVYWDGGTRTVHIDYDKEGSK